MDKAHEPKRQRSPEHCAAHEAVRHAETDRPWRVFILAATLVCMPGCVVVTFDDDGRMERVPPQRILNNPALLFGLPPEDITPTETEKEGEPS